MNGRRIGLLGHGAATLTWVAATVAVGLHLADRSRTGGSDGLTQWWFANTAMAVLLASPGWLIATRRPRNPVGWLLLAAGLVQALTALCREYVVLLVTGSGGVDPRGVLVLGEWLWPGTASALLLVLLLFPDGRTLSPRWRWMVHVVVAGAVVFATASALSPGSIEVDGTRLTNPVGVSLGVVAALRLIGFAVLALSAVTACTGVVLRFRRSRGDERLQMTWFVAAGLVMAVELGTEFVLPSAVSVVLAPLAVGLFAAAIAVAVLRYRLYDIDLVVNRSLVYLALSGCLVGAYLGAVTLLGERLSSQVPIGASVLAAALVAVVLVPLRNRLQRGVDRLMYGDRADPYAVLVRALAPLGSLTPDHALEQLCRQVATSLRLPYVAVAREQDGGAQLLGEHGTPAGTPTPIPVTWQGSRTGTLLASPRPGEVALSPVDRRLLGDLASQAGGAVYAAQVNEDLRTSRRQLIEAREEERRRLHADLHDGLGPTLAAVRMGADAAREMLAADPARADQILVALRGDAEQAITEIRRIVNDLRPPALDELGLVPALREQAARLGRGGCVIRVETPAALPSLAAAVEVATYRIATEAMTNVVRHSGADQCVVTLAVNGMLELTVADNGCGIDDDAVPGVGLASMRARTSELGGRWWLARADPRGTRLSVRLPTEVAT